MRITRKRYFKHILEKEAVEGVSEDFGVLQHRYQENQKAPIVMRGLRSSSGPLPKRMFGYRFFVVAK